MKKNKNLFPIITGTMFFSAILVIFLKNISDAGLLGLLGLLSISCWNIYAYFYDRTITMPYSSELDKNAEHALRSLIFYTTILFYFSIIMIILFNT